MRVAGQGAAHFDKADDPQRQRGNGGLGHLGQPQGLEQSVDPFGFSRARRKQATGIEHVAPQSIARDAGAVGQDQMLPYGQTQEQLGLLKCPGQTLGWRARGRRRS